jgi:GH24 family phage-related lysozyme (muramidase)
MLNCALNEIKSNIPKWYDHFLKQKNILPTFELIHRMRDSLTSKNFDETLVKFLSINEGLEKGPYLDSRGNWHIGYGLLLLKNESNTYEKIAIDAFEKVLGKNLQEFIPLSRLKTKDFAGILLNQNQCEKLLLYVLKLNECNLVKIIPNFKDLPFNMQIAIHSLYYNAPALIGPRFLGNLRMYEEKKDPCFLINCIWEIEENSNPNKDEFSDSQGIQNRRYYEGAMFSDKVLDLVHRISSIDLLGFLKTAENDVLDELLKQNYCDSDNLINLLFVLRGKDGMSKLPSIDKILMILKNMGTV